MEYILKPVFSKRTILAIINSTAHSHHPLSHLYCVRGAHLHTPTSRPVLLVTQSLRQVTWGLVRGWGWEGVRSGGGMATGRETVCVGARDHVQLCSPMEWIAAQQCRNV